MDFLVQRVATDGGSRVLINPTALIGTCEIDKNAKFLLTLTNRKDHLEMIQVAFNLRIKEIPKYLYQ